MTTPKTVAPPVPVRALSTSASGGDSLLPLLEQAEVCREQAREAAHLKRYRSALGLFATASALCRHVAAHGDDSAQALASERLQSLALEAATYGDLARSASRSAR